ncbi:MAG TPA: DNA helicase RecQ [Acidobacteriota bacterium]|nr:DNA helicase RecQ [Acidobacteriota bacterium]
MSEKAREILGEVFGFSSFRGQQEEIIDHLTAGGDALVLMPTGGGKSLCYQLPALMRPGTAVVVSPLIALMEDQVAALRQMGVRAAFLNSSLSRQDSFQVQRQVRAGQTDLLYVAPERLLTDSFLALLEEIDLALFAIDEAHCVSQWGHDFRPEYLQLDQLHERFPQVPRIATTATADGPTRKDIVERLKLQDARRFVAGFDRPNIRYSVVLKNSPKQQLLRFLNGEHPGDAGIVYCLSRRSVEETAAWLSEKGIRALPYHAGRGASERQRNQDLFQREDGVVIVATIAFGMGIDKSNVRFVAHLDLPKSLEAYYQETGRAGRDGLPANAWMTYGMADVVRIRSMLEDSQADDQHKRMEVQRLNTLLAYCETARCRRQALLEYFGETLSEPCGNCDTCLVPVETYDGSQEAQKALSCVYRTGQRFGAAYLIDVLRGASNERIPRFGHDRLPTFGVGDDLSKAEWSSIFRQLVAGGLLRVDLEGYGGLQLTSAAAAVLRGEESFQLRRDPSGQARRVRSAGGGSKPEASFPDTPQNRSLWEALRDLRLRLAHRQEVPPYVIFHDSTLTEMVARRPASLPEMLTITGVGQTKLDKYGEAFLDLLQNAPEEALETTDTDNAAERRPEESEDKEKARTASEAPMTAS